MTRLPTPGSDSGQWGDLLNEFLSQAHTADGKLKTDSVSAAQLAPGSVQNSTLANGVVTNAKLDDGTKASLAKADSSLQAANNLSDVADPAAARASIGAGTSSLILGTTAGTAAAGDDSRFAGAAQKSANLSDLANAGAARDNLGLGDSATKAVGTTSGTVAAGDDARLLGVQQVTLIADTAVATAADDSALTAYRLGLARRDSAPVRIVALGASTTEGWLASRRELRWVDRIGAVLGAGTFITPSDPSIGRTSGTITEVSEGLSVRCLRLAAGAVVTIVADDCDAVTILHTNGTSNSGAFTVSIDGAAAATVTPATGSYMHTGSWTSPGLPRGQHRIKITASADTTINGLYAHRGDRITGVQMWNGGRAGALAGDLGNFWIWQRVGVLAPSLIALSIGANDYNAQVSLATFRTNLDTIITDTRALTPVPSVLVIAQNLRLDVVAPIIHWSDYVAVLEDLAADNADICTFVNAGRDFPTSQGTDYADLVDTDSAHPTDAGHASLAHAIGKPLRLTPFTAQRPSLGSLRGLLAWGSALTLGLADGATVTSWAPVGAKPEAAAEATNPPIYRATGGAGGRPGVEFVSASSHRLDTGDWASGIYNTPGATVFLVFKTPATLADGVLLNGRNGKFAVTDIAGSTLRIGIDGAGQVVSNSGAILAATSYVVAGRFNGSESGIWVNSLAPIKTGTVAAWSTGHPGIRLGSTSGGTPNLNATISEWAMVGRAMSNAEIAAFMADLGTRYGVAVV